MHVLQGGLHLKSDHPKSRGEGRRGTEVCYYLGKDHEIQEVTLVHFVDIKLFDARETKHIAPNSTCT